MTRRTPLILTNKIHIPCASASLMALALAACSAPAGEGVQERELNAVLVESEDGLQEAYEIFKQEFIASGQARRHAMGFGPVPFSTSEPAAASPTQEVSGSAVFAFEEERVFASIIGLPVGAEYDLWLQKNAAGSSVQPDAEDTYVFVGTFSDGGLLQKSLEVDLGQDIHFDFDALMVSEAGQHPTESLIYFGARTLFEKRFFREQAGEPMSPVSGAQGVVETLDPLVARGAELFFEEEFGGNGRTCGTCHRAENNLTIDPEFIATLPDDDPLFVAEFNDELAGLERPDMMRRFGVILENVDGFDDLDSKFVLRSVNHTLALSTTLNPDQGFLFTGTPPDQRTGWGGDGAPGRGTLQEFTIGAVNQHFPRRLEREVGTDFRMPTQEESDALEAFQLFNGRQSNPQTLSLTFQDQRANSGRDLFSGEAKCASCHRDVVGQRNAPNFDLDTGVESFTDASGLFPRDGGLGRIEDENRPGAFGSGKFNVPPLIEAADTAPFFHNHTQEDIESAVAFYQSAVFDRSPAAEQFSGPITLDDDQARDVAIFLRTINAAENIRQVRKRLEFIQENPGLGEETLFQMAVADTSDAEEVLQARHIELNPDARIHLRAARQTIIMTAAHEPGEARDAYFAWAFYYLQAAKDAIISQNPLNLF